MTQPFRNILKKSSRHLPEMDKPQSEALSLVIEKAIETTEEIKYKVIDELG